MTEYVVLIFAAIAVIIVAKMLAWPVKKIMKLAVNVVLGILMIYLVNTFGMTIGIKIPFNFVTALIAGVLGVPGVIVLILIGFFI